MSVARTARRRRKQYATGNLAPIYGKNAPKYRKVSLEKSANQLARARANAAKGLR